MALHYKGCGLANVWLKSGYKAHETKYGTAYSYEDIDGLYRAITLHLCASRYEITADVLRFLRKRLCFSQGELGAELGYTSQAVAKWEKGTSNIPIAVTRLVRLLCLNKLSPCMTLHDAFESNNTLSEGRLEFEYTNSVWKAVGAEVVMSDVQIKNPTYFDLTKFVHNNSVYLPRNYPSLLVDKKKIHMNEAICSAIDILREIPCSTVFRGAFAVDVAIPAKYEITSDDSIRKAEFTPATAFGNSKLELDSITYGTC